MPSIRARTLADFLVQTAALARSRNRSKGFSKNVDFFLNNGFEYRGLSTYSSVILEDILFCSTPERPFTWDCEFISRHVCKIERLPIENCLHEGFSWQPKRQLIVASAENALVLVNISKMRSKITSQRSLVFQDPCHQSFLLMNHSSGVQDYFVYCKRIMLKPSVLVKGMMVEFTLWAYIRRVVTFEQLSWVARLTDLIALFKGSARSQYLGLAINMVYISSSPDRTMQPLSSICDNQIELVPGERNRRY